MQHTGVRGLARVSLSSRRKLLLEEVLLAALSRAEWTRIVAHVRAGRTPLVGIYSSYWWNHGAAAICTMAALGTIPPGVGMCDNIPFELAERRNRKGEIADARRVLDRLVSSAAAKNAHYDQLLRELSSQEAVDAILSAASSRGV